VAKARVMTSARTARRLWSFARARPMFMLKIRWVAVVVVVVVVIMIQHYLVCFTSLTLARRT
jgi:hypothetical protein